MSGFDLATLLPYYLDETDEQIASLNDALLKLEQDPSDAAVLREAFRMIHSIKGSSGVMGFEGVKNLTHHLETFFDQLRAGKRVLDRPTLDLSFRCLDGLRDFHRELRSGGEATADLSGLTAEVIAYLEGNPAGGATPPSSPAIPAAAASAPAPASGDSGVVETPPAPAAASASASAKPAAPAPVLPPVEPASVLLNVVLAKNIPWPDMKAKLVLSRLAAKARILRTEPNADQIENAEVLESFQVWLVTDAGPAELKELADVEGVVLVDVELIGDPEFAEPEPAAAPAPAPPPAEVPPPPPVEQAPPPPVVEESPPTIAFEAATFDSAVIAPAQVPAPAPPTVAIAPEKPPEPRPAPPPSQPPKKIAETLRVDVDRLDALMNLAGELVINRARFNEIAQGLEELYRDSNARLLTDETQDRLDLLGRELEGFSSGSSEVSGAVERWMGQFRRLRDNFAEIRRELDLIRRGREQVTALADAIHQLGRVSDGIQKGVLETRMVPIGPLFERFHRVVRDLRVPSGKEVQLKIEGEKTELDKRMIDELGDPLIHMVRNSVDHDLEPPDLREKLGKPRSGTVSLQASHRGNSVVITVSDDGRGIDPQRILKKIVEKGLVTEDEARRMSDRQLIQYIWHPGLSTAEQVTDISGRGVGMDIVKSRIESLNGSVDVRTEVGVGTVFTIRLPLTLAILPCLLFRIHDEVYAIPIDHIDEIVEVDEGRVFEVRGKRMIEIRKRLVSLVKLEDILSWAGGERRLIRNGDVPVGNVTAVVAQNGETTIGLVVDQLLGMQEVVLKSLEKNFRPVQALSGASILGDGRVSLILDVDALINMVARRETISPMLGAG